MLRKLLLRTTLLVLFFAFLVWQGWSMFARNASVKNFLQTKLQTSLGDASSIKNFRIGLGGVYFSGVQLAFKDSPYEIAVEELQLRFSLASLLKGGGDLQKSAEEIIFNKPRLTIKYTAQKETKTDVNLSLDLTREQEEQYRSFIKEYDFIKRVTISDGEIVIHETRSGQETRVAKQINGWARTHDDALARLAVAGHLFDSKEYNMLIHGRFDLQRGRIDSVNVILENYKLSDDLPFLLPHYFDVLDGTVNGRLQITERRQPTRGFNIEGGIILSNAHMKLVNENLYFEDIFVDAEIKDWNLYIKRAAQKINGSPTLVEGMIKNLLAPELELRLTSQQLDVERFLREFFPQKHIPLKGLSQLDITFSDSFASPQITGAIKADSLWWSGHKFTGFETKLNLRNQALAFAEISGGLGNAEISGAGRIVFLSPEKLLDFEITLAGDFTRELQQLGALSADHCVGRAQIKILGPLAAPVSRGEFKLFFTEQSAQSLTFTGAFTYSDQQLSLNTASSDHDCRIYLSAKNLFSAPRFSIEGANVEKLLMLFPTPESAFIREHYSFNLRAEGARQKPYILIDGYRRDNYEKLFEIATDTTAERAPNLLTGRLLLFPNNGGIPGNFELEVSPQSLKLNRLYIGNRSAGAVELLQRRAGADGVALLISGFQFSRINSLLGNVLPPVAGNLYGRIDVQLQDDQPKYFGELWLLNGFIKNSGPFKGELSFAADASQVVCRRLALEKTDGVNIFAKGSFNFSTQEVDGEIAAHNLDINELVYIVTGQRGLVGGSALVQASLKGRGPNVPIYGSVQISNAKVLVFEFDRGQFDFGGALAPNGSYLSLDALQIGRAVLEKSEQFVLSGSARLPITNKKSLDIHMSGDGNFLSLLSDIDPFFEKTSSSGRLDLHIAGRYLRPDFSGSTFTCQNGVLYLTSVTRKVENLEADLRVRPQDYFLDIVKLQGTIRKEPFWISNTGVLTGINHGVYEPLRVAGDDLNLGAIFLRTGPNGVPLNIPALMESGDIGWYELVGKDSLEQFFVAGPWANPLVRGEVRTRNANLVFPFEESAGGGEYSLVQKIIDNINWDVRARSIKDTRYVKQFTPGVYVNMEVDAKNSALEFSGILRDSTFRIVGEVQSSRGEFEYVDLTFRVEKFGAEFDRNSLYPVVYGKAWTVVRDTANVPSDVYLELYTVDDRNREVSKGRWDRVNIKLSSEFPGYAQTEKDIMATLGYSSATVEEQATRVVGYSTDKFLFRPIIRPIERQLERRLGLDVVRFSYAFARNFLDANLNDEELSASLALLRSSRLVLGKYLTEDIYINYSGELKAGIDFRYQERGVGLQHVVGLEYRLNQSWLLQMEYDYNTLLQTQRDDKKIWLRHSFTF